MKEIELTGKTQSEHNEFAPVEISENITIEVSRDIRDESYVVEGNLKRNGKDAGRFVVNEDQGRFFVNIPIEDVNRNTKREIVETIAAIVLNLLPEEAAE